MKIFFMQVGVRKFSIDNKLVSAVEYIYDVMGKWTLDKLE